jgi:hypothetical protein
MSNKENNTIRVALRWMFVGIPLLWGISQTIIKSLVLFR